jgi:hypothetical protein
MPTFKVRTPDGQYFNVTVPPGTTKEQALAYAQANRPQPQGALDPAPIVHAPGTEPGGLYDRLKAANRAMSPKGFLGPGLIAKGATALQGAVGMTPETPQQNYDRTVPGLENIVGILGSLAPGPQQATMVRRMATNTAIPAIIAGLGGKGLGGMQEGAATGAVSQLGGEALGGLFKMGRMGSLANTARAEFEKQMANRTAKMAHDQSMLKTLETIDASKYEALSAKAKEAHETAKQQIMDEFNQKVSTHEDLMAGSIMDEAKKSVPAWQDIPSTLQGLLSATLGKGKDLLSKSFDAALEAAKGAAIGKAVSIPVRDQQKLGVAVRESKEPIPSWERVARDSGDLRMLVPVDAAELIDRLPGLKDKGIKSRAQQALYDADLGISPEAMAEYKVGKGTIDLVDENKIFKFDPTTNAYRADREALANGLLSRQHMDTISNREMGTFDTFNPLRVAEQGPMPPVIPPLALPEMPAPRGPLGSPPLPVDPDVSGAIKTLHIPGTQYSRAKAGSVIGGLPGLAIGAAIPKGITTKAPMSPQEDLAHQLLPALLGALFRTAGNPEASAAEPPVARETIPGVTPADLAEIRAAQDARATAADNPALQLEIAPKE